MSSDVNKPTGLGYTGTPWRECICHHGQNFHYGHRCYALIKVPEHEAREKHMCPCTGFTTREREEMDRKIQHEWEYVDEALYRELKEEVKRRG